ncbi:MAG: transcription elongation factor GreA [Clostridia bacterium]|nr:transcription elongation factor GreA [Clostridia bacterium]
MAITVTKEGKLKLEEELSYLKNVKRKEVTEAIRIALGFGDLSENSEYDEAKTEQGKVENRIAELEEMLKNVIVVSEITTDVVNVGSKVRIYNKKWDEEILYSIVGSTEADPLQNKISDLSPIGKAILGKKAGETVVVETPQGHVNVKILEITK